MLVQLSIVKSNKLKKNYKGTYKCATWVKIMLSRPKLFYMALVMPTWVQIMLHGPKFCYTGRSYATSALCMPTWAQEGPHQPKFCYIGQSDATWA